MGGALCVLSWYVRRGSGVMSDWYSVGLVLTEPKIIRGPKVGTRRTY